MLDSPVSAPGPRPVRARLTWLLLCSVLLGVVGCSGDESEPGDTGSTGSETSAAGTQDSPAVTTQARFADVTESAGLDFTYRNGEEAANYSILESLGGGLAFFDYDQDGRRDLYAPGGGRFDDQPSVLGLPGRLYRHTQPFRFADVTAAAQAGDGPHYSHGATVGDYDADGFPDLLVTGYGGLLLLHNQGDGTFRNVTAESGLDADHQWSSSAAWADLTGDGVLDLYVAHYVNWSFDNHPFCKGPGPDQRDICPPRSYDPLQDVLFFGNADGTFTDVTETVGLRQDGKGLGVLAADVDIDGDVDIYVANDTVENFLYRNDGGGKLTEVALISGTSRNDAGMPDGSMGVDLTDYNLDGLPDLWVVNYERESLALYRNEGQCNFQHVSQSTGIKAVAGMYVSWGTGFFDFDCDGDEDVFVSNGHVIRYPTNSALFQKPLLLENIAGRRFENVSGIVGGYFDQEHMGRGIALADLDDDGRIDIAVSRTNQPLALLRNQTPLDDRHWFGLRLVGTRSPRDAIGARVEVRAGDVTYSRQIKGGSSYASTNDARIHFGLGARDAVEEVTIHWPSGSVQHLQTPPLDVYLDVVEPIATQ